MKRKNPSEVERRLSMKRRGKTVGHDNEELVIVVTGQFSYEDKTLTSMCARTVWRSVKTMVFILYSC